MEEQSLMQKWYNAAQNRVSIRKYSGMPSKSDIKSLKSIAHMLSNEDARIVVGACDGIFKLLVGTMIRGTKTFAAVIQKSNREFMSGYVGEAFLLECCARGLGTCWVGGSYNRRKAKSVIELNDDERIVCLIAFGIPDEIPNQLRSRKSLERLTGLDEDAFSSLPEWQRCALRCARLAPSAMNSQPWAFDIFDDSIQVSSISRNFGFGSVDCGIAMLHVELGAAHCGLSGDWRFKSGSPIFTITEQYNI